MDEELREHLRNLPPEEAERLETTFAALRAVPDEEIPQRIAFVSDKVFEPRWWQRFPVWGLASAAMLSFAVLAHGMIMRPARSNIAIAPVVVDTADLEAKFNQRLEVALQKAQAENDARLKAAVADTRERMEFDHRATMLEVQENYELIRKQMSRMYMASAEVAESEAAR
jgi:hypothetical protein